MSWFTNRSTMTKLLIGFSLLSVAMAAIGYVAATGMSAMSANAEVLFEKHFKGLRAVDEANLAVAQTGRSLRALLVANTNAEKQRAAEATTQNATNVANQLERAETVVSAADGKQKIAEMKSLLGPWSESVRSACTSALNGKDQEARIEVQSAEALANRIAGCLEGLKASEVSASQHGYEEAVEAYKSSRSTLLSIVAVGLLSSLGLGYWIARLIAQPLGRCVAVLQAVAKGDLSQRVEIHSKDEAGQLANAVDTAIGSIRIASDKSFELSKQLEAIGRVQAVIEFKPDGTIVSANENLLAALGYTAAEILGRHHSMFVDPATAAGTEYRDFWAKLARGEFQSGEFKRLAKGNREIWIRGGYYPIPDALGKIQKVVKFASEITADKKRQEQSFDMVKQLEAIGRTQAMVEFKPDGTIVSANDSFLAVLGYSAAEIAGRHHSMFVDPATAAGTEYRDFWARMARGEFQAGEFKRLAKGGREIWIRGGYYPIADSAGKIQKVVKFASEISADIKRQEQSFDMVKQLEAIGRTQAVIEFKPDGTIVSANENFLSVLGYTAAEIAGRHHSMFVDPTMAAGPEYRDFWAKLSRGEFQAGEFRRIAKGGREIWIRGGYYPIADAAGKIQKVVKFASEITADKKREQLVKDNTERQQRDAEELRLKVDQILVSVNAMAEGDFTQSVPDLGEDTVGQMGTALNKAITSVRTTLEGVREVSEQLADASAQLAAASEEISTGAQQQASSLEQTASTLEEITSTVKQNSDSAQQARQLASSSRDVAEKGGQVVGSAVEAMGEINASSKKIADIIIAIDEIAFQTNLLALNAAVEAARAGEQGRGFAVVASEVRNLAQRSAAAAKEIKNLIQDSVKKVDAGTDLVNRSGATLGEIVTSVKRVTDIITEIAAASREQTTGIEQVNIAVSQMDQVTQRNASQTEEMSATAQTLTEQASQLRSLVAQFKLSGEQAAPAVRPKARTQSPAARPRPAPIPETPRFKPRGAVAPKASKNGRAVHELDTFSAAGSDGFTEF